MEEPGRTAETKRQTQRRGNVLLRFVFFGGGKQEPGGTGSGNEGCGVGLALTTKRDRGRGGGARFICVWYSPRFGSGM